MPVAGKDGVNRSFHHRGGPFHPYLSAILENLVPLMLSYMFWQIYHILLILAVAEK